MELPSVQDLIKSCDEKFAELVLMYVDYLKEKLKENFFLDDSTVSVDLAKDKILGLKGNGDLVGLFTVKVFVQEFYKDGRPVELDYDLLLKEIKKYLTNVGVKLKGEINRSGKIVRLEFVAPFLKLV